MKDKSFIPPPGSLWLVVVECRYNVIAVSPKGDGFFIPGQEPCWGFDHVAEWIREIERPDMKDKESWDDRPGNWMDKWGACKVCGGELPHGHSTDCDIYKGEMRERELRLEVERLSPNLPELIGMCNCGHFEPNYTKHDTCAHCGKPWTVMRMLNALYYLHNIYEDEVKLKKYWRDKAEAQSDTVRQLCPTHPEVNYKTAWGCPDCVKELRETLATVLRLNYDPRRYDMGVDRPAFDAWNDEQAAAWAKARTLGCWADKPKPTEPKP